jgi:DNA-directed RNA polymerase specialized sigma subunit
MDNKNSILSSFTNEKKPLRALNPATMPGMRLEQEYQEPYTAWKKNPTPETTGVLVKAVKPIIDKGLRSYGGGGQRPTPIIRAKAKQIVMDSLDRYDPKQAKLQTHLMEQLKGLYRYAGKQRNILSVPERVLLDRKHLDTSAKELQDWLGREPSDKEVADKTGLSLKRIKYVRQLQNPVSEGMNANRSEQNTGEPQLPPVAQQDNDAWVNFVYHGLSDINGSPLPVVMEYTLGLHGKPKLSTAQLAQKLNLSPGRVSQLRAQVQAQLDRQNELNMRF